MGREPNRNKNLPPKMRARHRGKKVYYYYDLGGRPRREESLGSDFVEAIKKWSAIEQADRPVHAVQTFIDAADAYMRDVLPLKARRTQLDNIKELAFLRDFFGQPPAPLDAIEPVHIRKYMTWRAERARAFYTERKRPAPPDAGHVRANREIALFSHIFNFARDTGRTSAPNPCLGLRRNSERGRDVYVEDELYQRVYKHADQPTRDALDLAYLVGQRPADTLSFDERDIKNGELWVKQSKTRAKVRIEITGELAEVVERIRARKRTLKIVSTALIVNEEGQRLTAGALRYRFDAARAATGIDKNAFQLRDLRAKAGTDKAESSGDIRQAQKQLGHGSVTMTEHYVRNRKGDKVGPTR